MFRCPRVRTRRIPNRIWRPARQSEKLQEGPLLGLAVRHYISARQRGVPCERRRGGQRRGLFGSAGGGAATSASNRLPRRSGTVTALASLTRPARRGRERTQFKTSLPSTTRREAPCERPLDGSGLAHAVRATGCQSDIRGHDNRHKREHRGNGRQTDQARPRPLSRHTQGSRGHRRGRNRNETGHDHLARQRSRQPHIQGGRRRREEEDGCEKNPDAHTTGIGCRGRALDLGARCRAAACRSVGRAHGCRAVRTGRVRPCPIQRGHGAMRAMSPTRARRVLCELPFQGVARVRIPLGAFFVA
jgi:hypothetical protein